MPTPHGHAQPCTARYRRAGRQEGTLSRRRLLSAAPATGVAALLASCQVQTAPEKSHTPGTGQDALTIPKSRADLPTRDVTVRWMSGGPGAKSQFFEAFVPAYHRAHPHLTIAYDELPNDKIAEVLPIQLRNGKADDIFQTIGVTLSQLVAAGKVAPLDDIVPDFAAWKKRIPFGVLVPGSNQFHGKTYALPPSSARVCGTLLIYNSELMHKAGHDPSESPLTWKQFRAVAKRITKQGDGHAYGLLLSGQPGRLSNIVGDLAQLAGAPGGGFNWRTGEYDYAHEAIIGVIDLLRAMLNDGSIIPGWVSQTEQQARAKMPQGSGGMMLQGAWNFPVWRDQAPDFDYGVARQPTPGDRSPVPLTYAVGGGNGYSVFAKAPDAHQTVAGDLLHYLGTEAGQTTWARLDGAADPAWSPSALEAARTSSQLSEQDRATFELYDELMRLEPSPLVRNPENARVELELPPVHPDLGEVVQGLLTGQVPDAKKALTDLNHRQERALDQAIEKAKAKGARVSREDWKFPNWDPEKDFTERDYRHV